MNCLLFHFSVWFMREIHLKAEWEIYYILGLEKNMRDFAHVSTRWLTTEYTMKSKTLI